MCRQFKALFLSGRMEYSSVMSLAFRFRINDILARRKRVTLLHRHYARISGTNVNEVGLKIVSSVAQSGRISSSLTSLTSFTHLLMLVNGTAYMAFVTPTFAVKIKRQRRQLVPWAHRWETRPRCPGLPTENCVTRTFIPSRRAQLAEKL